MADLDIRVGRIVNYTWSTTQLTPHPQGKLEAARSAPFNKQASPEVRYDGKTAVITGSGAGLGRSYALLLARLGANVVVNDVSEKNAKAVVDEIIKGSRVLNSRTHPYR